MSLNTDSSEQKITNDEVEMYDRQIRLWGMDAQLKLRKSRILVVGVEGMCTEFCKNICLAGVSSVYLWDERIIGKDDLQACYMFTNNDLNTPVCKLFHINIYLFYYL